MLQIFTPLYQQTAYDKSGIKKAAARPKITNETDTFKKTGCKLNKCTFKGIKGATITNKHINGLLNALLALEREGKYLKSLDLDLLNFKPDGTVEISQKITHSFEKLPSIFPLDIPSNATLFERSGLCKYAINLEDDKKPDFVERYLKNKSGYHKKRAMYIKREPKYRFELLHTPIISVETTWGKMLENPSESLVDYALKKLEFLHLMNIARKDFILQKDIWPKTTKMCEQTGYGLSSQLTERASKTSNFCQKRCYEMENRYILMELSKLREKNTPYSAKKIQPPWFSPTQKPLQPLQSAELLQFIQQDSKLANN